MSPPKRAPIDAMLTIAAGPSVLLTNSRHIRKLPLVFTAKVLSHWSSVISRERSEDADSGAVDECSRASGRCSHVEGVLDVTFTSNIASCRVDCYAKAFQA